MREDKDGGFEDKEYSFKLELAKEPFAVDFHRLFPDPIVQRLGHCPFTAVTRVRIPLGSPKTKFLVIFASAKTFERRSSRAKRDRLRGRSSPEGGGEAGINPVRVAKNEVFGDFRVSKLIELQELYFYPPPIIRLSGCLHKKAGGAPLPKRPR